MVANQVLWKIELLRELRVRGPGEPITRFRTHKTGALLAYLAYHLGTAQPREVLLEVLWPEDEPESARHKLSVALSSLRAQLEPPGVPDQSVLAADRLSIALSARTASTDVAEFEALLQRASGETDPEARIRQLTAALELYQGPLLPGFYEDWIGVEQQRLEALYFEAVREIVPLLEERGRADLAVKHAVHAVAMDPLREENQRLLVRLYAATGRPEAALRQLQGYEELLRRELGGMASANLRRLREELEAQLDFSPMREGEGAEPRPSAAIPATPSAEDRDSIGGAVPLESPYYVERKADAELRRALERCTSIVLVKGARQAGKSSLLARALQFAREEDRRAVCTDLQLFNNEQFQSANRFMYAVARDIRERLGSELNPAGVWDPEDGPNTNFRRFMRELVKEAPDRPLIWALDHVDRLFECSFGTDVFSLLRAWHNERALDPTGPWSRLSVVIAYATEAHLFITDANQSPFNVGTGLAVEDFTRAQVEDLNRRYQRPLRDAAEVTRFYRLVNGHPFLVRRGLLELVSTRISLGTLETRADWDDWIYGAHLRRVLALLTRAPELCESVREVLKGGRPVDLRSFYRLRSAGVFRGVTLDEARLRCELYRRYLSAQLFPRDSGFSSADTP
jgi:DNA-binding SARP family transcriptional activator